MQYNIHGAWRWPTSTNDELPTYFLFALGLFGFSPWSRGVGCPRAPAYALELRRGLALSLRAKVEACSKGSSRGEALD